MHAPASADGPGIDARGAAFPGVNLYVELGRGRDYAWSATSAGQDMIDTFAVPLCGGRRDALHVPRPVPRDGAPGAHQQLDAQRAPTRRAPGTETLVAYRTKLGIVTGYAKVKGQPVAYTQLRSTYFHEVDSAGGFSAFNDPEQMKSPQDFQRAASLIGYTFNWFYVDDKHFAYFNSGNNPVRHRGRHRPAPDAGQVRVAELPLRHPHARSTRRSTSTRRVIDGQPFITSWNNKQARGYAAADTNLFSSVYRSQLLDRQIRGRLAGNRKMALPELVDAMEEAGTVDLRAQEDLPLALEIIGTPADPAVADAVAKLKAWLNAGFQRRDRDNDERLRARRRDPDPRRVVAAVARRRSSSRGWARRCSTS